MPWSENVGYHRKCYHSYINSKVLKRITGVWTTRRSNRLTRSKSKAFLSSKSLYNFIYDKSSISDNTQLYTTFLSVNTAIPGWDLPFIGVPILGCRLTGWFSLASFHQGTVFPIFSYPPFIRDL